MQRFVNKNLHEKYLKDYKKRLDHMYKEEFRIKRNVVAADNELDFISQHQKQKK